MKTIDVEKNGEKVSILIDRMPAQKNRAHVQKFTAICGDQVVEHPHTVEVDQYSDEDLEKEIERIIDKIATRASQMHKAANFLDRFHGSQQP